jgi:hypothetical protein
MSKEDELVSRLVEAANEVDSIDTDNMVEQHYNYYGDCGVADLVQKEAGHVTLYEIKSPEAVSQSSGANEILRQFNRMREYYFQDHDVRLDWSVTFELCFTHDLGCLRHIEENADLYSSVPSTDLGPQVETKNTLVSIRPYQGSIMPAILFSDKIDYRQLPAAYPEIPNNPELSDWIRENSKFGI